MSPKFKAGDVVKVTPCEWPWHVGNTYRIHGEPFMHDDDVPDGDEWWYFIGPVAEGPASVLPESVLMLNGERC